LEGFFGFDISDGKRGGGGGVLGAKMIVSILQCGHSTVAISCPFKSLASNSILPLQF
jgi:hypothetical protein